MTSCLPLFCLALFVSHFCFVFSSLVLLKSLPLTSLPSAVFYVFLLCLDFRVGLVLFAFVLFYLVFFLSCLLSPSVSSSCLVLFSQSSIFLF